MLLQRGAFAFIMTTSILAGCDESRKPATEIRLAVSGGAHAGTVEVRSEEAVCTQDLVGKGSWGVQYTDPLLETSLGSMQLIVPSHAPDGTSSQFYLGVVFESFLAGVDHEIETRAEAERGSGHGIVRIESSDMHAALAVTGRTQDGIGLSAQIRCHLVRRQAKDS